MIKAIAKVAKKYLITKLIINTTHCIEQFTKQISCIFTCAYKLQI